MLKKSVLISSLLLTIFMINYIYLNNSRVISKNESFISSGNLKKIIVNNGKNNEHSIGEIRIPKIGLKRKLYDINSSQNNVDENVTILNGSILPGEGNSIIFLAAHSGNGENAYFDKVKYLDEGDSINLFYNNINYNYEVLKKKEVPKTGHISGIWNYSDEIVLTTCSDTKGKQLIIYGILKKD